MLVKLVASFSNRVFQDLFFHGGEMRMESPEHQETNMATHLKMKMGKVLLLLMDSIYNS